MEKQISDFQQYLMAEEKSAATIEKYLRDVRCFAVFLADRTISKEKTVAYKEYLTQQYAPASVNSMLAALNGFLRFIGRQDCCVKQLKIQRQMFCREEKELTQAEYRRLVKAAGNTQLSCILQTICGTGIRISELPFITAAAVEAGKAVVNCKNKTRVIFIPAPLQKILKQYIKKTGAKWLPFLAARLSLPIPRPIAMGRPSADYPYIWSVNRYIEGESADAARIGDRNRFAGELALFLQELQSLTTTGAPRAGKHNFFRGAGPAVYHGEVCAALAAHKNDLPVELLSEIWDDALSSEWERPPVWIHGDVAPGNLIVQNGSLSGVIDFGIMGVGDPACDYAMAWTFFDRESRTHFLKELDGDTIARARGWALWKALITCTDARPSVAENAKRTLKELIGERDGA